MPCHDGPCNAVAQADMPTARTQGAEGTARKEKQKCETA